MTSTVQFVDSIVASPGVLLDLNNPAAVNGIGIDPDGIDLSPPPLVRVMQSSMLTEGERQVAARFDNRTIKLKVHVIHGASPDAVATAIQALGRQLNQSSNILMVKLEGMSSPVFFRTLRAPDYTLRMLRLLVREFNEVELTLPAEYAGYGLRETISGTISTNPAAANGCFLDADTVKGDVETPALIRWPASAVVANREILFALRRGGDPSAVPFTQQAEALTLGTDTTLPGNDGAMSGAGSNYARISFGTATMVTRLTLSDLGTASVDLRGRYRVFARVRRSSATGGINARIQWGVAGGQVTTNASVPTALTTNLCMTDLGEIQIPRGWDPITNFRDGRAWPVSDVYHLALQAERTGGTSTLDVDHLQLVPADDRLAIYKWVEAGPDRWWFDAEDGSVHARNSSDQIASAVPPIPVGPGLPWLSPGKDNRVFMLYEIGSGMATTLTTIAVEIAYFPLYLTVRPAST